MWPNEMWEMVFKRCCVDEWIKNLWLNIQTSRLWCYKPVTHSRTKVSEQQLPKSMNKVGKDRQKHLYREEWLPLRPHPHNSSIWSSIHRHKIYRHTYRSRRYIGLLLNDNHKLSGLQRPYLRQLLVFIREAVYGIVEHFLHQLFLFIYRKRKMDRIYCYETATSAADWVLKLHVSEFKGL